MHGPIKLLRFNDIACMSSSTSQKAKKQGAMPLLILSSIPSNKNSTFSGTEDVGNGTSRVSLLFQEVE